MEVRLQVIKKVTFCYFQLFSFKFLNSNVSSKNTFFKFLNVQFESKFKKLRLFLHSFRIGSSLQLNQIIVNFLSPLLVAWKDQFVQLDFPGISLIGPREKPTKNDRVQGKGDSCFSQGAIFVIINGHFNDALAVEKSI